MARVVLMLVLACVARRIFEENRHREPLLLSPPGKPVDAEADAAGRG